jgi:predicted Rossmann fold nucleotide-binding protein DprA/Smf involved in DNA uptake
MTLSTDSLAILLLCSQLGLYDETLKPLSLREWNVLARKLQAASLRPADLLVGSDASSSLDLSVEENSRIKSLISRDLNRELNRLESLGIFILTRADTDYPQKYRSNLKDSAPAILFYAGDKALLGQPGIAVVGSRHLDDVGKDCAAFVGNACGLSGQVLYSGGAKGVDTISMEAALDARGAAVSMLADSLERAVKSRNDKLERGDLCLVTPYSPSAGFSVGAAMGRNRLIYALADYAIVVASDAESGGTWAGATENLRSRWVPLFVLQHPHMLEGNKLLLQKGAIPFPYPFRESPGKLLSWLKDRVSDLPSQPVQAKLF